MKLALRLGRTVPELLRSVSGRELTEWMAFDAIEPIGDTRMDLGFGVVAATVRNSAMVKGQMAVPLDFMPIALANKPKPSWAEQLRAKLRGLVRKGG